MKFNWISHYCRRNFNTFNPIAFSLLMLSAFLASCNRYDNIPADVKQIIMLSGENQNELVKVIDHFSTNPDDSLKLKAAFYLIRNMQGWKTLDTNSVASNKVVVNALSEIQGNRKTGNVTKVLDSLIRSNAISTVLPNPVYVMDLKYISGEFLIQNIELAFLAWKTMPWSNRLSFSTFCEGVLPYRASDTYSENSRRFFFDRYRSLANDHKFNNDKVKVAEYIISDIRTWFEEHYHLFKKYPFLRPFKFDDLLNAKIGDCADYTSVVIQALRAVGIPATSDAVPHWGNAGSSHFWPKVVTEKNGELLNNENDSLNTRNQIPGSVLGTSQVSGGIPDDVDIYYKRHAPKIFRTSFTIQPLSKSFIMSGNIPPFFRNDRLVDVTKEYLKTVDLVVNIYNPDKSQKYLYLCVSNDKNWIPVDYVKIDKPTQVTFKNVGKNIAYLPAYYKSDSIIPAGSVVTVDPKGKITQLNPSNQIQIMTVKMKYPYRINFHDIHARMLGGRFLGATKKDLSDTVLLYEIKQTPFYCQRVKILNPRKYRFLIYSFTNLRRNFISDIKFFEPDNSKPLTGHVIGETGVYPNVIDNAFDSSVLSYFESSPNREGFIGIDMGENNNKEIDSISYLPRGDDNAIQMGETYELFYWNNKWISLGCKTAMNRDQITYKCPKNSLMLIINKSGGLENRIFTYNNKQIFW